MECSTVVYIASILDNICSVLILLVLMPAFILTIVFLVTYILDDTIETSLKDCYFVKLRIKYKKEIHIVLFVLGILILTVIFVPKKDFFKAKYPDCAIFIENNKCEVK